MHGNVNGRVVPGLLPDGPRSHGPDPETEGDDTRLKSGGLGLNQIGTLGVLYGR